MLHLSVLLKNEKNKLAHLTEMSGKEEEMKRVFFVLLAGIIVFLTVGTVFAQEQDVFAQEQAAKISGLIIFRNNIVATEKESHAEEAILAFLRHDRLGLAIEADFNGKNDYEAYKVAFLWKASKSYDVDIVAGIATDNKGEDFVDAGIWLGYKLGKVEFFLDLRDYIGLKNQEKGYTDNFLNIMYPITENVSVGVEAVYDHWWKSADDYYLIGPKISLKYAKIKLNLRYSHDWYEQKIGTAETNGWRFEVEIPFNSL